MGMGQWVYPAAGTGVQRQLKERERGEERRERAQGVFQGWRSVCRKDAETRVCGCRRRSVASTLRMVEASTAEDAWGRRAGEAGLPEVYPGEPKGLNPHPFLC